MTDIGKDWRAALTWDKQITETAQRLYDDLQRHDQADLKRTVGQIDPQDMPAVSGTYGAKYGKGFKQSVQDDTTLSAADKAAVVSGVDTKTSQAMQRGADSIMNSPQFGYSKVLATLGQDMLLVGENQTLAANAAGRESIAKEQSSFYIPFLYDHRAEAAADLSAAQQDSQSANQEIQKEVGSFSDNEIQAIQQLSLDQGGKGFFQRLIEDQNLSPETRAFIKDRADKAGLGL